MYVTEAMLEKAARRWGEPRRLALAYEISSLERALIRGSRRDERSHDVTLFIERDGRFAVIAKPMFPPGVWRAPSGGLLPGEDLEVGARREALEETGLDVRLERYLLRIAATFTLGPEVEPWHTHVFLARALGSELAPRDRREIRAARWATREELQGAIREALLATGHALFAYRVALTDAAFVEIDRKEAA
jgi:ADP-ribose pyrophosphatase YjhB (NUDIX family)